MKSNYKPINEFRHSIFKGVAEIAYDESLKAEGYLKSIKELPSKIYKEKSKTDNCASLYKKETLSQIIRATIGLSLKPENSKDKNDNLKNCLTDKRYYEAPLINIIKEICNKCPENIIKVSSMCQGCSAHPCQQVCPKNAISFENGKSVIDQNKCIKCTRCISACPYNAITQTKRPCAQACGVGAIKSDSEGRAEIDYDKCCSCGACLTSCPFGAIIDKSQIFQLIQSIKKGDKVIAIIAPAFVSQFKGLSEKKIRPALKSLGFYDVADVSVGADLCVINEAEDFLNEVPSKIPFMATSCCPPWAQMIKKFFPENKNIISSALTPMVFSARLVKKQNKDVKVCFIGPCVAKKLEAMRKSVESNVDYVITFEELWGMFDAKKIDFETVEEEEASPFSKASSDGRGFAVSGGVAEAVSNTISKMNPNLKIETNKAQGLSECKKMMMVAKVGKYNGYLLEGMACPGGCVAGPGTICDPMESTNAVNKFKNQASIKNSCDSKFSGEMTNLKKTRG